MSLLSRLTDRLILCPSTHPVDSGDSVREVIKSDLGNIEAWVDFSQPASPESESEREGNSGPDSSREGEECDDAQQLLVVKFPGTGGRAERSTINPCHLWPRVSAEFWTINPLGYGGSDGIASLQNFPVMIDAVSRKISSMLGNRKLLIYGNSLGTISALSLAARWAKDDHKQPVAGLYLRNCVPIHQLVGTRPRYFWPSLGLSKFIAARIPAELDAVANAARVSASCLFVSSGKDRVVPPQYQQMVIDRFAGDKRVFLIPDADHQDSIPETMAQEYFADLDWLHERLFAAE